MFSLLSLLFITYFFKKFIHYYKGPISDHYDGKIFYNPEFKYEGKRNSVKNFLKWKFLKKYIKGTWPNQQIPGAVISEKMENSSELRITYVGHSSFLLQINNVNILLDPVWSDKLGIWPISYKRVMKPGIELKALPNIDFVFVSHSHYDHCDISTLEYLAKTFSPKIIVPLGLDYCLRKLRKYAEIIALDWHQTLEIEIPTKIKFCVEPAHHWSSRYVVDANKSLWASLVIQIEGKNIYFSCDTAFAGGINFDHIRKKYSAIDIAFLPIGAYEPREFLESVHMNPFEAVNAAVKMNAKVVIPMHYDTFRLANESFGQPIKDMKTAIGKYSPNSIFEILKIGVTKYF